MKDHAPAEIRFQMGHEEPTGECADAACSAAEVVTEPMVALAAVAISFALLLAFAYVRDARDLCHEERERARTEADALARFSDRVSTIESGNATYTTGGAVQSVATVPPDARLERIREAYRETVMGVQHYEEDYGDTLPESMAEEFGIDVAAAVCHGDTLSPQLQRTLVGRTRDAIDRRQQLENAIEEELATLERGESDLAAIDRERRILLDHVTDRPRYGALVDVWHRLHELENRIGSELEGRQAFLRDPPLRVRDDLPPFHEYLYEPLEVDHPVLASGARLAERIRTDRDRVLDALARSG